MSADEIVPEIAAAAVGLVVIEDSAGERATVDAVTAAEIHVPRGFSIVGPAFAPGDPRTVEEVAEQEAAERRGGETPSTQSGAAAKKKS